MEEAIFEINRLTSRQIAKVHARLTEIGQSITPEQSKVIRKHFRMLQDDFRDLLREEIITAKLQQMTGAELLEKYK